MAKFRFRFQPVLRQRELAEKDEQLRVARVEQQRISLEDRLRGCQRKIENEQGVLNDLVRLDSVNPAEARAQSGAIAAAKGEAQHIAQDLAGVYKRLANARKLLTEAAMHRRSMELLRDNQHERWRRERSQAEDQAMDELTIQRASRTGKEQL